jgi:phytoene/squalene synthetase
MSADVISFPGDGLSDRPISEQEVDRLHSKNFRDLEGRINDCAIMAAIAHEMAMAAIVGIEPKHEKAQFAVCKAAQMLKQLQADYQAAWYGELNLDGEQKP